MNFLTKIEDFINTLLIRLGELVAGLISRVTPDKTKRLLFKVKSLLLTSSKELPSVLKRVFLERLASGKAKLLSVDIKGKVTSSIEFLKNSYKTQSAQGSGKVRALIRAPFALVAHWLEGLSSLESSLLVGLTMASVLAAVGIFSSGRSLFEGQLQGDRAPASTEDPGIIYERPAYYKKEMRHVLVTNIRLPVYFAEVNDLRTVDIDFNVTVSSRESKMQLERLEFQLRDFLIVHMEPLIASFPLEDEGREIVKSKIWMEIDNFMKEREITGHVEELKITYVLAN